MSENLSRLAQKIDFAGKDEASTNGNAGTTTAAASSASASSAGEPMEQDPPVTGNGTEPAFKSSPSWPWESCRGKLQ
jgi:hypothetical protein